MILLTSSSHSPTLSPQLPPSQNPTTQHVCFQQHVFHHQAYRRRASRRCHPRCKSTPLSFVVALLLTIFLSSLEGQARTQRLDEHPHHLRSQLYLARQLSRPWNRLGPHRYWRSVQLDRLRSDARTRYYWNPWIVGPDGKPRPQQQQSHLWWSDRFAQPQRHVRPHRFARSQPVRCLLASTS